MTIKADVIEYYRGRYTGTHRDAKIKDDNIEVLSGKPEDEYSGYQGELSTLTLVNMGNIDITGKPANLLKVLHEAGRNMLAMKPGFFQPSIHVNAELVENIRPKRILGIPLPHRTILKFRSGHEQVVLGNWSPIADKISAAKFPSPSPTGG